MPGKYRWSGIHFTIRFGVSDLIQSPLIHACPVDDSFKTGLLRLQQLFSIYSSTSPEPLPAPGLAISPEIRLQSELYIPVNRIRQLFYRLYEKSLNYSPILSSSPFYKALSWADCYSKFPEWLQISPNPAILIKHLLNDEQLLTRFIFYSFLPKRFNGSGFGRYPKQLLHIRRWFSEQFNRPIRLLDAASGTGEGTWELLELSAKRGINKELITVEGWTLEPLEVWVAEKQDMPHELERSQNYKSRVKPLLEQDWGNQISFKVFDLLSECCDPMVFDLIICNGLIGGPIVNHPVQNRQLLKNLTGMLAPDGILLLADHFHGGWKKQGISSIIEIILNEYGFEINSAGEGISAYRRDRQSNL